MLLEAEYFGADPILNDAKQLAMKNIHPGDISMQTLRDFEEAYGHEIHEAVRLGVLPGACYPPEKPYPYVKEMLPANPGSCVIFQRTPDNEYDFDWAMRSVVCYAVRQTSYLQTNVEPMVARHDPDLRDRQNHNGEQHPQMVLEDGWEEGDDGSHETPDLSNICLASEWARNQGCNEKWELHPEGRESGLDKRI